MVTIKKLYLRLTMMLLSVLALLVVHDYALAQDDALNFFKKNASNSTAVIDHSKYGEFLADNLLEFKDGVTRFNYIKLSDTSKRTLKSYLSDMEKVKITSYNRNEQHAFWINLYNAMIIDFVIDNYPIKSIRQIKPWKTKKIKIEGQELSLDDVEHRILRPIYKDWRIHFVLNVASHSSGALPKQPFTGANIETHLENATGIFLSDKRGIDIDGNKIKLTSVFKWYREDFGGSDREILDMIKQYTTPEVRGKLSNISDKKIIYDFDWKLNDTAQIFK